MAANSQDAVVYTLTGTHGGEHLGVALAPIGDLDDDGAPDFLVGAQQDYVDGDTAPPGYVKLISGRTGKPMYTWDGYDQGAGFGRALAVLGDIDGDRKSDFAVGSEDALVTVISGGTRQILYTIDPPLPRRVHNTRLCASPDLNGDGVPDLIISDPPYGPGTSAGFGWVGAFSGSDHRTLWTREGEKEFDVLGVSVAALGDIDGDGLGDLAVSKPRGSPHTNRHPTDTDGIGEVMIVSGKDGSVIRILGNDPVLVYFGESVANVGDLDGDGRPELAIGAPGFGPGEGLQGWVGIYSMPSFRLIREFKGVNGFIFQLNLQGDVYGYKIASAGDADGDRVPDILLGAERWSSLFDSFGRVDLRSGRTGQLLESFEIPEDDRFLGSLSGLGDLDGDGRDEFLIGAWEYPPITGGHRPGEGSGAVFVMRFQPELPVFLRGDANSDGLIDITDAIYLGNSLFFGGPPGDCALALDTNGSGSIDPVDMLVILQYLFLGSIAPSGPSLECGRFGGLRQSSLDCRSSPCTP
jgi:hypothetical protein